MIVQTIKVLFKHLNRLSEHQRLLEMLKLAFVQETGCGEAGLYSPHDLCWRQSDARFLSWNSECFMGKLGFNKEPLEYLEHASIYINAVAITHLSCEVVHLRLVNNQYCLARYIRCCSLCVHYWLWQNHGWGHYKIFLVLHACVFEVDFGVWSENVFPWRGVSLLLRENLAELFWCIQVTWMFLRFYYWNVCWLQLFKEVSWF